MEKIAISTNFLADIETGKSQVSSLTLVKWANCFGIEVYELFRPENVPNDAIKEAVKSLVNVSSIERKSPPDFSPLLREFIRIIRCN